MTQHILTPEHALNFILGGNATLTLRSKTTGTRFTYKITAPSDQPKDGSTILFVKVLTGSDNENSYMYIGYLRYDTFTWTFMYGRKSKISHEAPSVVAFEYCLNNFIKLKKSHPSLEIWHEGRCCRCGRKLTVPESIESGIGPECASIKAKHLQSSLF